LTFHCDLHCRHCFTEPYNNPRCIKDELGTKEAKLILEKAHRAGVLWLAFTGGDPVSRKDFLSVYSYAKEKGFLITVFTNGYSVTEEVVDLFRRKPPFVVEITLNAVTGALYDRISQVKGSFDKVMRGIDLILRRKLPLKIKTQVTKDNWRDVARIKKFLKARNLEFLPSYILYPRLNRDTFPCRLRITPRQVLSLDGSDGCLTAKVNMAGKDHRLFPCVVSAGDGFIIDPYGNIILCLLIRKPRFSLLKVGLIPALRKLCRSFENMEFLGNSQCRNCSRKAACWQCPGKAYLENGNMQLPIDYYCELSKLQISRP
jgi:radical SAM protein with 4Fe4S-binding SPASM domain